MQPLTLLLASLAVYRLSRMISDEEGPFALFTKLRSLAPQGTWVQRGVECILCLSFWVALPAALYIDWTWTWPLTWLALSAVTVIIRKWEQKR